MARQAPQPSNDPRLRPFRVAAYSGYLVVVIGFCLMIIVNVFRSVFSMSPGHRPPAEPTLTVRECLDGAEGLWRQMDEHRRDLTRQSPVRDADAEWSRFRVGWVERLRDLESRCAVESHSRESLKGVFQRLDRLMDLYTTHAVQFAGEIGGSVDELKKALDEAHRDPAAGRFP